MLPLDKDLFLSSSGLRRSRGSKEYLGALCSLGTVEALTATEP